MSDASLSSRPGLVPLVLVATLMAISLNLAQTIRIQVGATRGADPYAGVEDLAEAGRELLDGEEEILFLVDEDQARKKTRRQFFVAQYAFAPSVLRRVSRATILDGEVGVLEDGASLLYVARSPRHERELLDLLAGTYPGATVERTRLGEWGLVIRVVHEWGPR